MSRRTWSVRTAASGRRWQPPRGKRGNLEDSFSASLSCRGMWHRVAQALPESHLCHSDYWEPTPGFLSPVRWTQTPCELQSLRCSGLYWSFYICFLLQRQGCLWPLHTSPFPLTAFALPCLPPDSPFLPHPSQGIHACTRMCLHTHCYRALGQTIVSSGSLLKASHLR